MMKTAIVVDTSVLISALIGEKGPSRAILRNCLTRAYTPLISNALFQEYETVSGRENILELCPVPRDEIREFLNAFYNVCKWVPLYYLWRPNLLDENDNFLIELAVAGNANSIITNNVKDFMNSELLFPDISIMRPEEFLQKK